MKLGKLAVLNLLYVAMLPATAQSYDNFNQSAQETSQNTKSIRTYLKNWGAYFGYDITKAPSPTPLQPDFKQATKEEENLFNTFFGSIPTVTTSSGGSASSGSSGSVGAPFLPSATEGADTINAQSNLTFKNYASVGQQDSATANALIDQFPLQSDPVSQSILNILGTPDVSYCTDANGLVSNPTNPNPVPGTKNSCSRLGPIMFQNQVVENVLGVIPQPTEYYNYVQNANVLPQLNSNALIAPLSYGSEAQKATSTNNNSGNPGLTAQNQIQQAANFIRYVSGSVVPTILPNQEAYNTLYGQAMNPNTAPATQAHAQAVLSSYLTSLRVYAAQTSVGMGNLYYILSRRISQQTNNGDSENKPSSQAQNEYRMATWRIKPAESKEGSKSESTWIDKINQGSPATVQKEIAVLLSEINYQLYLDRQIQERLLMTSSVSLLQGTKAGQPSPDLSNQTTSAASGSAAANP